MVASHSRQVSNQDADICWPGGARPRNVSRPDSEIATLEVAQVLAGVCEHSLPFDGDSEADIEPMNVHYRSKMDSHFATPMLDDIYEPTIPESEGQVEETRLCSDHSGNIRSNGWVTLTCTPSTDPYA